MAAYSAAEDDTKTGYQLQSKLHLEDIVQSPNLCDLLDEQDITYIGSTCFEGYTNDVESRRDWELRQAEANKLALQVYEAKTFPWPNASSVKFPLITVAALQFHARAYPALVNGNDLVKCRVIGDDPDGSKDARAKRIAAHMSWQCLEQDLSWEEEHDKGILVEAIAGTMFKKKVFEPGPGHNMTMLVLPDNFIINYYAKDIKECQRYTHRFYLNANNLKQRELDGRFRKIKSEPNPGDETEISIAKDDAQGTNRPPDDQTTPYLTAEQYCWFDLDGDGYQEPYIVTFDIDSQQVRRIVARFLPSGIKGMDGKKWDGKTDVYKITPVDVFTKYEFIPSPDGGFYALGLGSLLGPINETVNTTINQMLDAGTMATLGGGFLGRGFKSKGGPITFQPNQWYPVDAPGDDLRKNVLPLPVREPSAVLFQLLGLLLQYSERIVSATEMQMGENVGQNTPAETARTMNENGSRVYNAIYKRNWRAMRNEFRIQYGLNNTYLEADEEYENLTTGKGAIIKPDDYLLGTSLDVRPAADPHVVSDTQRIDQAKMLVENSLKIPGHNRYESLLRLYTAMRVPDIEKVLPHPMAPGQPGPDGKPGQPQPIPDFPPPPNPKMMEVEVKQGLLKLKEQEFQAEQMAAKIELQQSMLESQAHIAEMYAKASKLLAEAKGAEVEPQIKLIYAQIEAQSKHQDQIKHLMDILDKNVERTMKYAAESGSENSGAGMGGLGAGSSNAAIPGMAPPISGQPPSGVVGGGVH